MVVTLGQQYNIGEKPTVILYTYINRHAGTPEKQRRQNSTSNMEVIIVARFLPRAVLTLRIDVDGDDSFSRLVGSNRISEVSYSICYIAQTTVVLGEQLQARK